MSEITTLLFVMAACLFLAVILIEVAMPKRKPKENEGLEKRLERLEKALSSNSSYLLSQKLGNKLERLESFRMNAEVEIRALKECIDEMKGRKKSRGKELSTEEMRKLIFRSK